MRKKINNVQHLYFDYSYFSYKFVYSFVDKGVLGSDWWPFREHEERIGKECIGIKLKEWKGMLVPYQI